MYIHILLLEHFCVRGLVFILGGMDVNRKTGRKKKQVINIVLGGISAIIAVCCFMIRMPTAVKGHGNDIRLVAAGFIMPSGKIQKFESQSPIRLNTIHGNVNQMEQDENDIIPIRTGENDDIQPQHIPTEPEVSRPHEHDGKRTYRIIETRFTSSGMKHENFYINNASKIDLNVSQLLKERPDVHIKKNSQPQVLIYHTHTTESYMDKDEGFFYEDFYPRTTDKSKSVVKVGDAICESLEQAGIKTVHDTTYHDSPAYNGSYSRSRETIKNNLKKYPSIQVVIDIHRDGLGNQERGKIKPTFKINGRKAAQIMIMAGCDKDGTLNFPDWQYNLRLALRLQKETESMNPGMTRPLFLGPVKYNMALTHGSLLIEVGSDSNTLDEAVYSGSLLGKSLASVLNNLTD